MTTTSNVQLMLFPDSSVAVKTTTSEPTSNGSLRSRDPTTVTFSRESSETIIIVKSIYVEFIPMGANSVKFTGQLTKTGGRISGSPIQRKNTKLLFLTY